MTEYRTGNHHGITIVAEGDGARCGRPDHDCARGHLVAVVVEGGGGLDSIELAERICALLNGAMRQCAALAALDQAATDMRAGYPGHGHPIEYVNGWEDADAFAEGFASGDAPRGPLNATESGLQGSGVAETRTGRIQARKRRMRLRARRTRRHVPPPALPGRRTADRRTTPRLRPHADADYPGGRVKLSDLIIGHGPYESGQEMPAVLVSAALDLAHLNELREELIAARKLRKLREVLDALVDPDPCWFDHHGHCQAHGANLVDGRCGDAVAKELLAELNQRAGEHAQVCR